MLYIENLFNNEIENNKEDFVFNENSIFINKNCSLDEFKLLISKYKNFKNLSLEYLITTSNNLILEKQKIYISETDNKLFYIISSNEKTLIIKKWKNLDAEIIIELNDFNRKFNLIQKNNNLNNTQLLIECYKIAKELENKFGNDCEFLIRKIYYFLNLIPEKQYNPIITDGEITLSWIYGNKNDINKSKRLVLDIILNETKEIVGDIAVDFNNYGFTYAGNVSYEIKIQYRNKHYATKALKLVKKLAELNEFNGDKDLYIATLKDNYISQKVALNNGGILCYEGNVPTDNDLYYIDGVDYVKVYKIKIKN